MLSKHLRPGMPSEPRLQVAGGGAPSGGLRNPAAGPSAAGQPNDVLEATSLGRLIDLDPTGEGRLLEKVFRTFQSSVARLLPQLDAARAAGDPKQIGFVAHTFKSSSAAIGALTLSQLCAQLEAASKAATPVDLNPGIDAMTAALDIVLAAIARRLESP